MITIKEKESIVKVANKKGITLDGEPAKLVGVKNHFPTVATVRNGGASFEWSWKAIRTVINDKNGNFQS